MVDGENNGRVTVAVLGQKIDALTALVQEVRNDQRAQAHDITALQSNDVALSGRIDRTNDRISVWTVGQTGLGMLWAAIAAWWGSRP